jgi:hypothetical protein
MPVWQHRDFILEIYVYYSEVLTKTDIVTKVIGWNSIWLKTWFIWTAATF